MIGSIFPYKTQLNIFQLEGYSVVRLLRWTARNFFKRRLRGRKALVFTLKAKVLLVLALVQGAVSLILLSVKFGYFGAVVGLFLISQPYIFLSTGSILIRPIEFWLRERAKRSTRQKISELKRGKLQVIGITGSGGKTTVKEILYHLLKTQYRVLRTPESYNTVLGIAKVCDFELDSTYDFFICEMGAYKKGEIKEISSMVLPDHAILTGINEQHLERFRSLENIIQAKFELVEYVSRHGSEESTILLNGDDRNILNNYQRYVSRPLLYRLRDKGNPALSLLERSRLLGRYNRLNLLAAIIMAEKLGVKEDSLRAAVASLRPISHRLESKRLKNGNLLIDNSYSSNIDGFKESLNVLTSFKPRQVILVTPGIIELGRRSVSIHRDLGELANRICDQVWLVGKNKRTLALAEGIHRRKVVFLKDVTEFSHELERKEIKDAVILLENDLPDNY